MITEFRLPVTQDQEISVIYQKPEAAPEPPPEPEAPSFKKKKPKLKPPQKPLVIMMHGFPGGHKSGNDDLFGAMEFRLEELGYPSVRFDFRGCGESDCTTGEFCLESAIEDVNTVMDWAKHEEKYKSVVLMGESCGATVAVMGYRPKYVAGLVLLWPAIILRETGFRELFTREKLLAAAAMDAPFVEFQGYRLGSHFLHEIYNTDLISSLERIKAPILIQHGTKDEDVPLEQAYFARDHAGGLVDIGVFEGGDHGLHNPKMRKHLHVNIEHFLSRILKKLAPEPKS